MAPLKPHGHTMALMLLTMMATACIAAAMPSLQTLGVCAQDCYSRHLNVYECGAFGDRTDCLCDTPGLPDLLATLCGSECLGEWDSDLDANVCGEHLDTYTTADSKNDVGSAADLLARDAIMADAVKELSTKDHGRRISTGREARQERRAIALGTNIGPDAKRSEVDSALLIKPLSTDATLTDPTPAVPRLASLSAELDQAANLAKREPIAQKPKFPYSPCSAPGVTCGDGGNRHDFAVERSAEPRKVALPLSRQASHDTQDAPSGSETLKPSLCGMPGLTCARKGAAKSGHKGDAGTLDHQLESKPHPSADPIPSLVNRETSPSDKPEPWKPNFCGAPGATCGMGANAARDLDAYSGSVTDTADDEDRRATGGIVAISKRETEDQPVAVSPRGKPRRFEWEPGLCTTAGITCGATSGLDNDGSSSLGSDEGNAADDTASSAKLSESPSSDSQEKRDLWAAPDTGTKTIDSQKPAPTNRCQFPGVTCAPEVKATFVDDKGNAVFVEVEPGIGD